MTWGIVINNNCMSRPQYCGYNNLFNMFMTYNIFQSFMNSLFRPQTNQPQVQYPCCNFTAQSVFSQQVNPYMQVNPYTSQDIGQNLGSATYQNLIESEYFQDLLKSQPTQSLYPYLNLNNYKLNTVNNREEIDKINETSKIVTDKNFKNPKKLDKNFLNKVKSVAKNINCDYKDLLAIINNESGLNPQCGLKKDGSVASAVGLIQFMDDGAIRQLNQSYGLNLTREKIVKMSAIEQLDLVEKTYIECKKMAKIPAGQKLDSGTLYALIFLPSRANREVLCVKGERDPKTGKLLGYYEQNPMDDNGDQKLTKSELTTRINKKRVDESLFA